MSKPRQPSRFRVMNVVGLPVVMILVGSLVTTLLPWFTGREPALSVLRAREPEREPDADLLESIRQEFRLPASPWESIQLWASRTLRGDFGSSWIDPDASALEVATAGLGVTAALTLCSLVLALGLSFAIVIPRVRVRVQGRTPGGWTATLLALWAATPDFVLAVVFLSVFAVHLQILPVSGWKSPAHMVLPVAALAISTAGTYGRLLLVSADKACQEEWIEVLRVGGIPATKIMRMALWRAFVPTLPVLSLYAVGTMTATSAVEVTFDLHGFGRTVVDAARSQDIPVIQAAVLIILVFGVMAGVVAHWLRATLLAPLSAGVSSGLAVADSSATAPAPSRWWLVIFGIPLLGVVAGLPRDGGLSPTQRLMPMSAAHPLGTDNLGRDIWARLADGALYSIGLAILVTAACTIIGITAAHAGDWVLRVGDALNALPAVLIGLILAGVFGGSTLTAFIAVLLVGWIPLASHGAAVAQEAAASAHYKYAATLGATRWHLLRYHLLPATVPAIIRHAVGWVAHNAIALASLGYLGVGSTVGSPEWGVILNESVRYLERAGWMAAGPTVLLICLGIVATVATDRRQAQRS